MLKRITSRFASLYKIQNKESTLASTIRDSIGRFRKSSIQFFLQGHGKLVELGVRHENPTVAS